MIKIAVLRPLLAIIGVASLITACQTVPQGNAQTYSEPRIEAIDPGQRPHHRFWHARDQQWKMGWRTNDYQLKAFSACDGKVAGQAVTITLQNGSTIQGVCSLQFRLIPPWIRADQYYNQGIKETWQIIRVSINLLLLAGNL